MKKIFLIIMGMAFQIAFSQLPTQEFLRANKIKSVEVFHNPMSPILGKGVKPRDHKEKITERYLAIKYFFNENGLTDSTHGYYYGSKNPNRIHFNYNEYGQLVGKSTLNMKNNTIGYERLCTDKRGNLRYQKWNINHISIDYMMRSDSVIFYNKNYSIQDINDSSVYRYDFLNEKAVTTSWNNGKIHFRITEDWIMKDGKPDSLNHSFYQGVKGKGRRKEFNKYFKVLEDGSLEILQEDRAYHPDRVTNFQNRHWKFEGLKDPFEGVFILDEMIERSPIVETPEFTGTIRRHYYSYRFE